MNTAHSSFAWPRVAVYGAGAVGCYFGARLAEAGAPVTLIARPAHVQAIVRDGLLFESGGVRRSISIDASTDPDAVRTADLVLCCVKSRDIDAAGRALAPLLRDGAVVLSMQNGVDNSERLRAAGVDALPAVVYVATSMPAPGHLVHAGRGDLVLGEYGAVAANGAATVATNGAANLASAVEPSPRVQRIAAIFERAGLPCELVADARPALWAKLVMNSAFNAISALTRSRYGPMVGDERIRALMRELIAECVAVAHADGVALDGVEAQFDAAMRLGDVMAQASSSTAQDLAAGRPTEIDALNGFVAERGAALGVAAPVNKALHALVKLLEQQTARAG
ncbi:MAG: 2-dehydropantoate 2-reductase [Burkholderiales bacterium]|nr:2-dehydropantoate 2-reductase [Burkholderiales bacterium]